MESGAGRPSVGSRGEAGQDRRAAPHGFIESTIDLDGIAAGGTKGNIRLTIAGVVHLRRDGGDMDGEERDGEGSRLRDKRALSRQQCTDDAPHKTAGVGHPQS